MTLFRRTLTLVALMFWQGGFMFYGGVVVPVGSHVLGSHRAQSMVTQPVTYFLNAAGLLSLALWAWELLSGQRPRRRLFFFWLGLALTLGMQIALHHELEQQMRGLDGWIGSELASFRALHQAYLLISAVQWGLALVLLVFTLKKWREDDRQPGSAEQAPL